MSPAYVPTRVRSNSERKSPASQPATSAGPRMRRLIDRLGATGLVVLIGFSITALAQAAWTVTVLGA